MPAATRQSEPDLEQIRELEERLDNFRIQVADDLTIRGNAWQGYALNIPECPQEAVISPPAVCCDSDTITITFSGIVDCEGITGDLNGTFVLTETFPGSGIWEGAGNDYDFDPPIGPFPTLITIQCNEGGFSMDYRDESGNPAFFLTGVIPIPHELTNIPNVCDCLECAASEGTGNFVCG